MSTSVQLGYAFGTGSREPSDEGVSRPSRVSIPIAKSEEAAEDRPDVGASQCWPPADGRGQSSVRA